MKAFLLGNPNRILSRYSRAAVWACSILLVGSTGIFFPETSIAQGSSNVFRSLEANIWYFGINAGITFESGAPVALSNGRMSQHEGTAVACDPQTGELLFYTNGVQVWNREHSLMPNGMDLLGHWTSSQSALIVPSPGDSLTYFVFTAGAGTYASNHNNGFRYSIVDLREDGGRGDVVLKNVELRDSTSEKITATRHCNGRDYWVLTHSYGADGGNFLAYPVTASGVESAVISPTIIRYESGHDVQGILKFSPSGERLAMSSAGPQRLELYHFDRETGSVHDGRTIDTGINFYGVEFSPSSRYFYATALPPSGTPAPLVQYDLSAGGGGIAAIRASRFQLFESNKSWDGGQIQLGPDGRIYTSFVRRTSLGVIEEPERAGAAASYVEAAVDLGDNTRTDYGLPNFIQANLFFDRTQIGSDSLVDFCSVDTVPSCPGYDTLFCDVGTYSASATGEDVVLAPMLLTRSSTRPIDRLRATLHYDPDFLLPGSLNPIRIVANSALDGWDVVDLQQSSGTLVLEFASIVPRPLTTGLPLFRIPFRGFLGFSGDSISPVSLELEVPGDSCFRYVSTPGSIDVGLCGFSSRLMDLANGRIKTHAPPRWDASSDEVTLRVAADQPATLDLELYDIAGRRTDSRSVDLIQGENNLRVRFSSISSGLYLCRLVSSSRIETYLIRIES